MKTSRTFAGELPDLLERLAPNWAFRRDSELYVTDVEGGVAIYEDAAPVQIAVPKNSDLLVLQKEFASLRNAEQVSWAIQLRVDQQLVSELTLPIMGN